MIGCVLEVVAGGFGGFCLAGVGAWYLWTHRPTKKQDPTDRRQRIVQRDR